MSVSLVLLAGVALEAWAWYARHPGYFRLGLPIWRSTRWLPPGTDPTVAPAELERRLQSWTLPTLTFWSLSDRELAFRERGGEVRLVGYPPVMRGHVQLAPASRRVTVTGFLNAYPVLVASGVLWFAARDDDFTARFVGMVLLGGFLLGYAIQALRYADVVRHVCGASAEKVVGRTPRPSESEAYRDGLAHAVAVDAGQRPLGIWIAAALYGWAAYSTLGHMLESLRVPFAAARGWIPGPAFLRTFGEAVIEMVLLGYTSRSIFLLRSGSIRLVGLVIVLGLVHASMRAWRGEHVAVTTVAQFVVVQSLVLAYLIGARRRGVLPMRDARWPRRW